MKKQIIMLAAITAVASFSMAAQKKGSKKKVTKITTEAAVLQAPIIPITSKLDSFSYSMGLAETRGLKEYATSKLGLDTIYFKQFIEGIDAGSKAVDPAEKAHNMGIQIGMQLANQNIGALNKELFEDDSTKSINKNLFLEGFMTALRNEKGRLNGGVDSAVSYIPGAMEQIKHQTLLQKYGMNKTASEIFLDENKKKDSIITTASGLQYKILVKGTGPIPTADQDVKVNYRGKLIDGKEFDSSFSRKEPATFKASQVIKGWTEALTMMPVGSKWEIYVPYNLAYGEKAMGPIKPFSALVFDVELLEIVKPAAPAAKAASAATSSKNKVVKKIKKSK